MCEWVCRYLNIVRYITEKIVLKIFFRHSNIIFIHKLSHFLVLSMHAYLYIDMEVLRIMGNCKYVSLKYQYSEMNISVWEKQTRNYWSSRWSLPLILKQGEELPCFGWQSGNHDYLLLDVIPVNYGILFRINDKLKLFSRSQACFYINLTYS